MTSRPTRRLAAVLVLAAAVAAGCGTTTIDETDDTGSDATSADATSADDSDDTASSDTAPDGSGAPDAGAGDAPPADATVPVDADTAIAAIDAELRGLGDEIAGEGDEDATLAVIEAAWSVASAELAETDPVTEAQLRATIEMVRVAVDRRRPADADKAYSLFTDIVAAR